MIYLYSIFHLNIAYSSIEEKQRSDVIQNCYWPLLRLAKKFHLPIGFEASGYTLERIAFSDQSWIDELQKLTHQGACEFIGSGYSQLIAPLVPAKVNAANLRLGNEVYKRYLGYCPTIALVNEQAYSAGLIQHYLDAGYEAIVMEWDNPARLHPEWKSDCRYYPQHACDQHGNRIALLWNNSIAFQKFQRYAHCEIEMDEYLEYLSGHISDKARAFSLYGNDVEIFDFRPGRYHTEAAIGDHSEWDRIEKLFSILSEDERFKVISPGKVLTMMDYPEAGHDLHLESVMCPVPVKKQGKYNITRWALTGRDDLGINSACWRIYEALQQNSAATDDDYKELCYLWSSDFRTHITERRWIAYCERLAGFEKQVESNKNKAALNKLNHTKESSAVIPDDVKFERQGRYLTVETNSIRIRFNCQRGSAIDALWFKDIADAPLIGTLQHGYYDDIAFGADFYSGHLILETPGQPKVTDLNIVEASASISEDKSFVIISAHVPTMMGSVHKSYYIYRDASTVKLHYELDWQEIPIGSLRLGHITFIPSSFERDSLFYRTHNGGTQQETFMINHKEFDHGSPVSFLVSANSGVGMTAGVIEMGDARRFINITVDKGMGALIGMLTYKETKDSYFYRLALSASEMDDTSRSKSSVDKIIPRNFCLTICANQANCEKSFNKIKNAKKIK